MMITEGYYINPVIGHELFVTGLIHQIQGYNIHSEEEEESMMNWIFPSYEDNSYLYHHLISHLDASGRRSESKELMMKLPWLLATIRERPMEQLFDVISEMKSPVDNVEDDKSLKLLYQCLQLCLSDIRALKNQSGEDGYKDDHLVLQLIGRLRPITSSKSSTIQSNQSYDKLKSLVRSCESWWRSRYDLFPTKFELDSPGGPLQMTINVFDLVLTDLLFFQMVE